MDRVYVFIMAAGLGTLARPLSAQRADFDNPHALVALADRMSGRSLWPNFHPARIPVAIFDGQRTFLFRHPSPPTGFNEVPGSPGTFTMPGRAEGVTANSSALIGGVQTATLVPGPVRSTLRDRAGTLIHEAFHVFARAHHKRWTANEAELFTYPFTDTAQFAMQRGELEALQRALRSGREKGRCWARVAMQIREQRLSVQSPGAAEFERKTELNEGLPTYVEKSAVGVSDTNLVTRTRYGPGSVRQRAYQSGLAIARLLDRYSPRWTHILEAADTAYLDVLLSKALVPTGAAKPQCGFKESEQALFRADAAKDVGNIVRQHADARKAFLARGGWSLVILAARSPLFPQGFDPLNVAVVAPGEVLHSRYVKLGNESGSIQVLDQSALTESAGSHPLFNGVKRVTITGLPAEPALSDDAGVLSVKSGGIALEFRGALVERRGNTLVVTLAEGSVRE